MKRYQGVLLATVGGLAAGGTAQAADMPIKARAVAPPPVATWTGCYIGASVGGAWHHFKPTYEDGGGNGFGGSGWGVIGGGTLGCNWQTNNWVWGLEGDFSGLSDGAKSPGAIGKGNATESDLRWLATARARLGYAVAGGMMAYVTGGVAVAKVKSTFAPNGILASSDGGVKSANKTKVGWTAGFGVEQMLSRNWTVGLEALYVNLGKYTGVSTSGKTSPFKHQTGIIRGKLNYKF